LVLLVRQLADWSLGTPHFPAFRLRSECGLFYV
jgi:hypothetical protein